MSDKSEDILESDILKYWKDISFPGSFRGLHTLQAVLKTDKGIDISTNKLFKILQKEPTYLIHQIKPFKIKRRSAITHNYGELVQVLFKARVLPIAIDKCSQFVRVALLCICTPTIVLLKAHLHEPQPLRSL